jgi:hypothetical protein
LKGLLWSAQDILTDSQIASFRAIGRLFSTPTGEKLEKEGFLNARTRNTNRFINKIYQALGDLSEEQNRQALALLNKGGESSDPVIGGAVKAARQIMDEIAAYRGLPKGDYDLQVFDPYAVSDKPEEFRRLLFEDYKRVTGREPSRERIQAIYNRIAYMRGGEDEEGYKPTFVNTSQLSQYKEKSLVAALERHAAAAVRHREWVKRFGKNNETLDALTHDGIASAIGNSDWGLAHEAAKKELRSLRAGLKGSASAVIAQLEEAGYPNGRLTPEKVARHLSPDAARRWRSWQPEYRAFTNAVEAMSGTLGLDIEPGLQKWSSSIIVYENYRLLAASLFSQIIDPMGVMVRGGTLAQAFDTFKEGLKGAWRGWKGEKPTDDWLNLAASLGIVSFSNALNSQGSLLAGAPLGKRAKRMNDGLFRWNGVEGFSQGTRVGAMKAAIAFLKYHKDLPTKDSERWLAELNLKPTDIKLTDEGHLNYADEKIANAIYQWVEGAILRPNAAHLAPWMSDPHWALVAHLKQFAYAFQKVLLERMVHELKHGNLNPLAAALLVSVPLMMSSDYLRRLILNGGETPAWQKKWGMGDYLADGVQRAGLLGVSNFALEAGSYGVQSLAGPAAEQVNRATGRVLTKTAYDRHLDEVAERTGRTSDYKRAEDYNGLREALRANAIDAMPFSTITRHYLD